MARGKQQRKEFEQLALVHLDAIYRAALRFCRNPTEAEDLTQDVFSRAYRAFHQFERGTNCRAWLFKILKNAFINRERSMSHTRANISLDDPKIGGEGWLEDSGSVSSEGPEEQLFNKITGAKIKEAVEELPENFRRIFILSEVEGFSYKEISQIEECPLGTVMSRLYRARRMLQSLLKSYVEEEDVRIIES